MSRPAGQSVAAAGALLWRAGTDGIEVALIHRPRYDDWSWPKGKLEPGESWPAAAAREVEEETGLVTRLGLPLPPSLYGLPRGEVKEVRYWTGAVVGGDGALRHEIDRVVWMPPAQARQQLTHPRDREQLDALLHAQEAGALECWPLLIVRHAEAVSRSKWSGSDPDRPLNHDGRDRALDLAPLLDAYRPQRVLSSPSARCVETVEPFTRTHGVRLSTKRGLSEEGFDHDPDQALRHLGRCLERAAPVAVCTHRPVLPALLQALAERAVPNTAASSTLRLLVHEVPLKGEVLACQVVGSGDDARIVSVERHLPG